MSICITLGEQSENHNGMELFGKGLSDRGYTISELNAMRLCYEQLGGKIEFIDLNSVTIDTDKKVEPACVLILRGGVQLFGNDPQLLYDELSSLEWDKKYWDTRRKRVLNKHARWNLCFGDSDRDPDYDNKQGRVIKLSGSKLGVWKQSFESFMHNSLGVYEKFECEGNYYYNDKCGIGFHGDRERKKTIGASFGKSRKVVWIWYDGSRRVSEKIVIELQSGDMYVMSEKATGWDFMMRSKATLRHAAGADKYIR